MISCQRALAGTRFAWFKKILAASVMRVYGALARVCWKQSRGAEPDGLLRSPLASCAERSDATATRSRSSGSAAQDHLMRPDAGGEVLQIADQIERFASGCAQLQRIPAQPHDKVRFPTSFGQEAFQNRHPGIIAIADPDFARDRRTTLLA